MSLDYHTPKTQFDYVKKHVIIRHTNPSRHVSIVLKSLAWLCNLPALLHPAQVPAELGGLELVLPRPRRRPRQPGLHHHVVGGQGEPAKLAVPLLELLAVLYQLLLLLEAGLVEAEPGGHQVVRGCRG